MADMLAWQEMHWCMRHKQIGRACSSTWRQAAQPPHAPRSVHILHSAVRHAQAEHVGDAGEVQAPRSPGRGQQQRGLVVSEGVHGLQQSAACVSRLMTCARSAAAAKAALCALQEQSDATVYIQSIQ